MFGKDSYAIEKNCDGTIGVEGRLVAAELRDLADEHHDASDKVVKIRRSDARGGQLFGHGRRKSTKRFLLKLDVRCFETDLRD